MTASNLDFRSVPLPAKCNPKEGVYLRLDRDLVKWFRGRGRGYQALINSILRAYFDAHKERHPVSKTKRLERAQELFREFHAQCFWHLDPGLEINEDNIELVIEGLRKYGGRDGFLSAEELCR